MTTLRIIDGTAPRELSRHQIEGTDIWLVRIDFEGIQELWAALNPPEKFNPARAPECFILATSEDNFAGLSHFRYGLAKVSRELLGEVS